MRKRWSNTFRVGIYKCEMTYVDGKGMSTARWTPDLPKRALSEQELEQYRLGRDVLVAEVAKDRGGSALVIET